MHLAASDRLLRSLEGTSFQSFDELIRAYEKLDTPAFETCVKETEIRELALYVGYDPSKGTWTKDILNTILNTTPEKVMEITADIERAIGLAHEWK
jgi:hypothetical protein